MSIKTSGLLAHFQAGEEVRGGSGGTKKACGREKTYFEKW